MMTVIESSVIPGGHESATTREIRRRRPRWPRHVVDGDHGPPLPRARARSRPGAPTGWSSARVEFASASERGASAHRQLNRLPARHGMTRSDSSQSMRPTELEGSAVDHRVSHAPPPAAARRTRRSPRSCRSSPASSRRLSTVMLVRLAEERDELHDTATESIVPDSSIESSSADPRHVLAQLVVKNLRTTASTLHVSPSCLRATRHGRRRSCTTHPPTRHRRATEGFRLRR